jgi:apolipoprotein N-acyltransferase
VDDAGLQALFGLSSLQTAGMLLLVCQCGLPFALLGWGLHAGRPATPLGRVLFAPAAWVSVEYLRAHVPFGTPWALLGLALAEAPTVAQIADVGGAYAISFTLVLASAALAETIAAGAAWQRLVPALTATATILGLVLGYGTFRYAAIGPRSRRHRRRVSRSSTRIANAERLSPRQAISSSSNISPRRSGSTDDANLIVWPENAARSSSRRTRTSSRVAASPRTPDG